jgi:hemerythrin superfamily protein
MATDPTLMLRGDHRKVEHLLHQIEEADPADRAALVEELTTDLTAHMKLEEDILYPVIVEALGEEEAAEAENEHEMARVGLAKVGELSPDGPGFMAALETLKATISHHVHDEEDEVFPQLDQKLAEDRRERLAQDLERARPALGLPTHDELPVYLSRDELYEKAKKSGVAGRSSMSKDELAATIPPEKS